MTESTTTPYNIIINNPDRQAEKTIGDILPAVDDFISTYQKHRGLIGLTLGHVKLSQVKDIAALIQRFKS